jgi:hypothetical protein
MTLNWRLLLLAIRCFKIVLSISLQQALAFQIPGQATGNGVAELIEFAVGRGFNPAKPCG